MLILISIKILVLELDLIEDQVFHFQGWVDFVKMYFGVDMSYSAHIDNKKDILILGKRPTQVLEHALTAEKIYSINFTVTKK